MSVYSDRTVMSLHHMTREMYRKNIELARIVKCSVQMILSGVSANSIHSEILKSLIAAQNEDGGFVANTDTIWNAKFLSFFPKYHIPYKRALEWLDSHRTECGFGRSSRDMGRIPVTGVAFALHPSICREYDLEWLEKLWLSEKNSLTYKAAYVLMAFKENNYITKDESTIKECTQWLMSQQESDGGFAPWSGHPVGSNIYCTAVSILGLMTYPTKKSHEIIKRAYQYIIRTQLPTGLWPFHEIEDGAAWGLRALTAVERELNI